MHCFVTEWVVDLSLQLSDRTLANTSANSQLEQLLQQLDAATSPLSTAVAAVEGLVPADGELVDSLGGEGTLSQPHKARMHPP